MLSLLTSLFCLILAVVFNECKAKRGDKTSIKINEPRNAGYQSYGDQNGGYQNNYGNSGSQQWQNAGDSNSDFREPNSWEAGVQLAHTSLVQSLQNGPNCFEKQFGEYNYKVCPFGRVTQHQNWYTWTLGIWKQWAVCAHDENALCLQFSDGQVCGSGKHRATDVVLVCDNSERMAVLKDISEPDTCHYRMTLAVPILCELKSPFSDGSQHATANGVVNAIDKDTVAFLKQSIEELKNQHSLDAEFRQCLMSLLIPDFDTHSELPQSNSELLANATKVQTAVNASASGKLKQSQESDELKAEMTESIPMADEIVKDSVSSETLADKSSAAIESMETVTNTIAEANLQKKMPTNACRKYFAAAEKNKERKLQLEAEKERLKKGANAQMNEESNKELAVDLNQESDAEISGNFENVGKSDSIAINAELRSGKFDDGNFDGGKERAENDLSFGFAEDLDLSNADRKGVAKIKALGLGYDMSDYELAMTLREYGIDADDLGTLSNAELKQLMQEIEDDTFELGANSDDYDDYY